MHPSGEHQPALSFHHAAHPGALAEELRAAHFVSRGLWSSCWVSTRQSSEMLAYAKLSPACAPSDSCSGPLIQTLISIKSMFPVRAPRGLQKRVVGRAILPSAMIGCCTMSDKFCRSTGRVQPILVVNSEEGRRTVRLNSAGFCRGETGRQRVMKDNRLGRFFAAALWLFGTYEVVTAIVRLFLGTATQTPLLGEFLQPGSGLEWE